MREPIWDQPRPPFDEIQALWRSEVFTRVDFAAPELDALLAAFGKTHARGGVAFAMFEMANHPVAHWFVSRNRFSEIRFFEHLLCSNALQAALPEIEAPEKLDALVWDWSSPYMLAGDFAATLMHGGAYEDFRGTGREAKDLGERACDALFGDRFEDVLVYTVTAAWSNWFWDVAWDKTWIGVDRGERRVWVMCLTDTD